MLQRSSRILGNLIKRESAREYWTSVILSKTLAKPEYLTLQSADFNRTVHSSAVYGASLQVKVPQLGESITDGTIATVLKQQGDSVEEDEPLLQIDTDKVTVDVRSPKAGNIEAILVQEGDTITVGQLIAIVAEGQAGKSPSPSSASSSPQQPTEQPPQPSASSETPPPPKAAPSPTSPSSPPSLSTLLSRNPSITFPPRRTPSGEPISMLSPSERAAALEALKPKPTIADPITMGSTAAMTAAPFFGGTRREAPPKPRKEMSEREMEMIMLGGADP